MIKLHMCPKYINLKTTFKLLININHKHKFQVVDKILQNSLIINIKS
jgi:hypothetical protein